MTLGIDELFDAKSRVLRGTEIGLSRNRREMAGRRGDVLEQVAIEKFASEVGEEAAVSRLNPDRVSELQQHPVVGSHTSPSHLPGTVEDLRTTSSRVDEPHVQTGKPSFAVTTAKELETQRAQQEAQEFDLQVFDKAKTQINQALDQARQSQAGSLAGRMARVKAFQAMGRRGSAMQHDPNALDAVERLVNGHAVSAEEFDAGFTVLKQLDTPGSGASRLSRGEKDVLFRAERDLKTGLQKVQSKVAQRPTMPITEWNQLLASAFQNPIVRHKGMALAAKVMPEGIVTEQSIDKANRPVFRDYLMREKGLSESEADDLVKHLHNSPAAISHYEQFNSERVPDAWYMGGDGKPRQHQRPKKSEHQPWELAAADMARTRVMSPGYRPSQSRDEAGARVLAGAGMTERDAQWYDDDEDADENAPMPAGLISGPGVVSWKTGGQTAVIDKATELYDSGKSYPDSIESAIAWGRGEGHIDSDVQHTGEFLQIRGTIREGMKARKDRKLEVSRRQLEAQKQSAQNTLSEALITVSREGKVTANSNTFQPLSETEMRALVDEYSLADANGNLDLAKVSLHVDANGVTKLGAVEHFMLDSLARGSGITIDSPAGRRFAGYMTSVPQSQWPREIRVAHQKVYNDFRMGATLRRHELIKDRQALALEKNALSVKLQERGVGFTNWMNPQSLTKVQLPTGNASREVWVANPMVGEMLSRVQLLDGPLQDDMMQRLGKTLQNEVYGADATGFWSEFKGMVRPSWRDEVGPQGEGLGKLLSQPLSKILKHDFTSPHVSMDTHFGRSKDAVTAMFWNTDDPIRVMWAERRSDDLQRLMTGKENSTVWNDLAKLSGNLAGETKSVEDVATGGALGKSTVVKHLTEAIGRDPLISQLWSDGKHMPALELAYVKTVEKRMRIIGDVANDAMLALGESLSTVPGMEVLLGDVGVGRVDEISEYLSDALDGATLEEYDAFIEAIGAYDAAFTELSDRVKKLNTELGMDKEYSRSLSLDRGANLPSFEQMAAVTKAINAKTAFTVEPTPSEDGLVGFGPRVPGIRYKARRQPLERETDIERIMRPFLESLRESTGSAASLKSRRVQ